MLCEDWLVLSCSLEIIKKSLTYIIAKHWSLRPRMRWTKYYKYIQFIKTLLKNLYMYHIFYEGQSDWVFLSKVSLVIMLFLDLLGLTLYLRPNCYCGLRYYWLETIAITMGIPGCIRFSRVLYGGRGTASIYISSTIYIHI